MQERLLAILIDHIVGSLIFGIIFFSINLDSFINPTEANLMKPFETFNTILGFGMIYYLLKDIFRGRSIGKKLFGLRVTDKDNKNIVPGALRLIIRNITILFWPIELLVLVLMRRRLGDIIAKTDVNKLS